MNFLFPIAALALLCSTAVSAEFLTSAVERIDVPRVYRLDGVVEAVNQSTVAAQTSGQVERVMFDVEDFVEKGALIAVLRDSEQSAGLEQAKANNKAAAAQLQEARTEYARIKGVFEKKLVSSKEMDAALAALKTARARHQATEAALEQSEQQLGYTQVRAPYTGIVTQRHIEPGEIAQPGAPLMTGIALDKLRVVVDVPQSVIPAVRRFKQARVQKPGNGWIETSDITVFPFADQGSNTFKVRVRLPEGISDVFPGMFIKTAFVTGTQARLVVPDEAVVFRSEVTGVYVVDDEQQVNFRHVRLGQVLSDGRIAVLAGLDEGEQVAQDPIEAGVMLKTQRSEQSHGQQ